jgi:xylan 1,4-beta-xylosidase
MAAIFLGALLLSAIGVDAAGHVFPDCVHGPLSNNTVCDTSASTADRAAALVKVLTNAEKFQLTGNTSPGVPRLGLYSYQWWRMSKPRRMRCSDLIQCRGGIARAGGFARR